MTSPGNADTKCTFFPLLDSFFSVGTVVMDSSTLTALMGGGGGSSAFGKERKKVEGEGELKTTNKEHMDAGTKTIENMQAAYKGEKTATAKE